MERVLLWLDDLEDLVFCLPLVWRRWPLAAALTRPLTVGLLALLAALLGLLLV